MMIKCSAFFVFRISAGQRSLHLHDGSERKFLEDGDTVIMKGHAEKSGVRIGFGECRGTILPAV